MFSFFKKKTPPSPTDAVAALVGVAAPAPAAPVAPAAAPADPAPAAALPDAPAVPAPAPASVASAAMGWLRNTFVAKPAVEPEAPEAPTPPPAEPVASPAPVVAPSALPVTAPPAFAPPSPAATSPSAGNLSEAPAAARGMPADASAPGTPAPSSSVPSAAPSAPSARPAAPSPFPAAPAARLADAPAATPTTSARAPAPVAGLPAAAPVPSATPATAPAPAPSPGDRPAPAAPAAPAVPTAPAAPAVPASALAPLPPAAIPTPLDTPPAGTAQRTGWLDRLKTGLRKTGSSITTVFTGTRIDDALYEELEDALLMADTGVKATQHLLADLKRRVKEARATEPAQVKALLAEALADLLRPLERSLVIGEHTPTVIMVAGVNGAGKTTSIGKLTKHLANEGATVLLAAADTFRAAAREQLGVWADRNLVEIIGQQGGDPAAVSFDAVTAGKARRKDVVLVDTAGRLPTQLHLMEELRKIRRVVQKADATAPHEVLLVIDGNTGQNALAQVRAFDDALQLTGLIVTKLDGTAKGGVLAAIAQERPVPVYFIGVGEKLEDLETFDAREFAQALLG
jgi:fused signal recognition particle receptor